MDREQLSKLQSLVEDGLSRTNIYIYILDLDCRFLYISPSAAASIGLSTEQIIGRTCHDLQFPADIVQKIKETVTMVVDGGRTVHGELTGWLGKEELMFEYDATPLGDGRDTGTVMALVIDRTKERRGHKLLEALNDINREISGLTDPETIMNKVVDLAGAAMGGDPLAIVLRDEGLWAVKYAYSLPPQIIGHRMEWAEALVNGLVDLDAPWVIDDTYREARLDQETVKKFDARSILSLALHIHNELAGAIIFFRQGQVRPYSTEEIEFGRKLANSVSAAISNSILYQETKRSNEEKVELLFQLAEEKELLRAMMEAAPVAMAMFEGKEPKLVMGNEFFFTASPGDGKDPQVGRYLKDMVDEEEYRRNMAMINRLIATGRPVLNEECVRRPPHLPAQYFQVSLLPIGDIRNFRMLMVGSNMTEAMEDKKRIEELALKADQERKQLRAILDTLPVGVVIVDAQGNVLESNELRDRIWGGKASRDPLPNGLKALKGRQADTGLSMSSGDWPVSRALSRGDRTLGMVVDIRRLDGTHATTLISAAPIISDAGKRIGAVGVIQDITEQRRLEHDAVEAKERAELYLDLLTHDVNNMNAAISGYIQLAMEEKGKRKQEHLSLAHSLVGESTKLIDNVQKLQRIESSSDAWSMIDLGFLLEEVREEQLSRPDNQAKIEYHPQLRRYVLATELLRDVFVNLIGNAVKHADRSVNIHIALLKAFEGGREFHKIVIEDDGTGIDDEVKGKVFVRQFRSSKKSKGSGLGLYLVKKLVEDYGGRVWVEDRVPGDHTKGAKFVVMLPAMAEPRPHV